MLQQNDDDEQKNKCVSEDLSVGLSPREEHFLDSQSARVVRRFAVVPSSVVPVVRLVKVCVWISWCGRRKLNRRR